MRYVSAKKTTAAKMLESGAGSCGSGVSRCDYVHFVLFAEGYAVRHRDAADCSWDFSVEVLRGARL